ncbi:hypothetical protein ACFO0N_10420 [Halobium salinum]|uniref:Uncharacterized protein n=1 Tax=Halobium salinum TaxID=1364940 RepID=A0ABD5PBR3_9EURY|nr:hypothetical protein [Halobium salinum]
MSELGPETLEVILREAFGGTDAERRVVVRQARDLADSGKHDADRGFPLTVDELLDHLGDAPADCTVPERWNWWLGSLEVAYGGYREFQVQAVERE